MAAVTLTTLRSRVRERADMVGSSFVADSATGLDAWINEAHQKLHQMLVDALGEEYVSSSSAFTTVAGQSDYSLPAGFYKLYGVDLTIGGVIYDLEQYTRQERNTLRNTNTAGWYLPKYSLVGSTLRLFPAPAGALAGTMLYAPEATTLVNTTDTVTYPNGWERFIVIDAAIQALNKEESNTAALVAERASIIREIETTKEQRDLAHPKRIVDVKMMDYNADLYW